MRIVINFSNNQYRLTPNEIFFLDKCFQLLVKEQSEHKWIPEPFAETKGAISLLPVGIKKSIILDKLNAELLITTGEVYKKKSAALNQIFFFNQSYESYTKDKNLLQYPSIIITTSFTQKKKIIETFAVDEHKVQVIPAAASEDIMLADWSEKLSVKDKYADGREFFFCFKNIGPNTQWEEILKAFSIFKKWQQSSLHLLIAGNVPPDYIDTFNEKFNSYKYRSDVKILDPAKDDIERILSCAFGLICAEADYTGIHMLNGFKAEVPVISSPVHVFDEEVSGAFLPALPRADELSRQLINLYRDEQMRDILIEKGKRMAENYSWETSIKKWNDCIESLA